MARQLQGADERVARLVPEERLAAVEIAAALEVIAALKEMVDTYQDEERGGVPLPEEDQPRVIQRAMRALRPYNKGGDNVVGPEAKR